MSDLLTVRTELHVATIAFNRPSKGNALTPDMVRECISALHAVNRDDVRVVVLTANGRYFCTGMDLAPANQAQMAGKMDSGETSAMAVEFYETVKNYPKPIVARINGAAMGGGFGLLLCCDIRVMVESAFLSFSEVKRGIVPAIISAYVVPELGASLSRRLFLTGEKISARTALDLGIITEVAVDADSLDRATERYVEALLENGPRAMAKVKAAVKHHVDHTHEENLIYVKNLFEKDVVTSDEALFGMKAFLKKEKPDWTTFVLNSAKL